MMLNQLELEFALTPYTTNSSSPIFRAIDSSGTATYSVEDMNVDILFQNWTLASGIIQPIKKLRSAVSYGMCSVYIRLPWFNYTSTLAYDPDFTVVQIFGEVGEGTTQFFHKGEGQAVIVLISVFGALALFCIFWFFFWLLLGASLFNIARNRLAIWLQKYVPPPTLDEIEPLPPKEETYSSDDTYSMHLHRDSDPDSGSTISLSSVASSSYSSRSDRSSRSSFAFSSLSDASSYSSHTEESQTPSSHSRSLSRSDTASSSSHTSISERSTSRSEAERSRSKSRSGHHDRSSTKSL